MLKIVFVLEDFCQGCRIAFNKPAVRIDQNARAKPRNTEPLPSFERVVQYNWKLDRSPTPHVFDERFHSAVHVIHRLQLAAVVDAHADDLEKFP